MLPRTSFRKILVRSLLAGMALLIAACDPANQPVRGFVLPEGNVAQGEQVFIKHGCYQCHTLPAVNLPAADPDSPISLEIGGKVYRVKDYGELLDAIVNPDHIISPKYLVTLERDERKTAQTLMPNFNDEMTVAELIDLVTFLHAQYSKMDPEFYRGYSRNL